MYPWVSLAKKSRSAPDLSCNTSLASIAFWTYDPHPRAPTTISPDYLIAPTAVTKSYISEFSGQLGGVVRITTGAPTGTYGSVSAL
jgi:hypothetical protein